MPTIIIRLTKIISLIIVLIALITDTINDITFYDERIIKFYINILNAYYPNANGSNSVAPLIINIIILAKLISILTMSLGLILLISRFEYSYDIFNNSKWLANIGLIMNTFIWGAVYLSFFGVYLNAFSVKSFNAYYNICMLQFIISISMLVYLNQDNL